MTEHALVKLDVTDPIVRRDHHLTDIETLSAAYAYRTYTIFRFKVFLSKHEAPVYRWALRNGDGEMIEPDLPSRDHGRAAVDALLLPEPEPKSEPEPESKPRRRRKAPDGEE